MRYIDTTYKQYALAPARRIFCTAAIGTKIGANVWQNDPDRCYTESDSIISAAVDIGSRSGGFQIGNAFCGKLTLRLMPGAIVNQTDRISLRVGFITADGSKTNTMPLGVFYVDKITVSSKVVCVTAYDKMLRAQKFYDSKLSYPCNMSDVLDEICRTMVVDTTTDFALPVDPTINSKPVKGMDSEGNEIYYTRREMLSYIASACASNFFFTGSGLLALSDFSEADETMAADNSMQADVTDDAYTVSGVAWVENGVSKSRYSEDTTGLMEFENPLPFAQKTPILDYIDEQLTSLSFCGGTVKRQGTGWYELGDIVSVERADGTTAQIMVSSISYSITDGGFTETIYSLATTESEDNYTTGDVTGQTVPQSTASQQSTFPPVPIEYAFKQFTNVDPTVGGGFELKSGDGTAKFEISENGIQLFRKNAANGYRAYIGADTYLTAYVEGSNSSVNAFLSSDSMSVGGSRYSIQSSNGMLYASAKDSEGTLCAQISINDSELVINYGSIYRLYLSDGEFTVKANNSPLLSVTATGLYVNGKKVLTEE